MLKLLLPVILILGLLTSYIDLKKGKIRNSYLILALIYTLVVHIIIFSISGQIRYSYFIEFIIMFFFSLIIGFIVWYAGLWTAGDAKLFATYSALVPLSVYRYGYTPYFSSANILVNTFVPVFIYLFIFSMIKTTTKQKIFYLKNSFLPKRFLTLGLYLFALVWVAGLIFSIIGIETSYFITIFLVFLFILILEKLFSVKTFNILIIISIIRLIFDRAIYSFDFITQFLMVLIIFVLVRFFALALSFDMFTKKIKIDSLKPGMVPAEIVVQRGVKYGKQKALFFGIFSYFQQKTKRKTLFELTAEGLTKQDIAILKKLKSQLGFESLVIQTTVPFAPFIFFGVLLTILFEGNMFFSVINIIKSTFLGI